MIIGKDDETKGNKIYLLHESIVIVTQHVTMVETLDASGNEDRQAHFRREDPKLGRAVQEQEEIIQRKKQIATQAKAKTRSKRNKRARVKQAHRGNETTK
ncbi:unnamed protein product [Phytophthora fragariaefolia]|uniref:Unnamed protein product n=1 Tax=Phytophthora fragariaefolia TaxID=1490495 RepID=A0A9W6TW45_9STRA|nr:unnamed protein product [Phytophthora fragariaefolia]